MTTITAPAVGLEFHRTESRPYTEDGVRSVHVRTDLCVVTEADDHSVVWEVRGLVSEENRPSFAGYPTGGSMLASSWPRRVADGTIRIKQTVGRYTFAGRAEQAAAANASATGIDHTVEADGDTFLVVAYR